MIKSTFGLTTEPFYRNNLSLLPQQQTIFDMIKIHSQHGGFSVVIGQPGVGKTVLLEHIQKLDNEKDIVVASFSRTLHTYLPILKQLAEAFRLDVSANALEKELIQAAYRHVRDRKTLYVLIDEAHLLDTAVLRRLRLLFDKFPKKHNLVLFGQNDLLYYLSMTTNQDIKTRITYSASILPLSAQDLEHYIAKELETVKMGINTYDSAAIELIIRSAQGNLRLCRNLCYAALADACKDAKRIVSIQHVNNVLIQPHWRSHEDIIKQQVS